MVQLPASISAFTSSFTSVICWGLCVRHTTVRMYRRANYTLLRLVGDYRGLVLNEYAAGELEGEDYGRLYER